MTKTVFLSTVSSEFGSFRRRLASLAERTKKCHVRHQDDFFHRGTDTLQKLFEEIQESDVILHIIGSEAGWSIPADLAIAFLDQHREFADCFPGVAELGAKGELPATQWEAWIGLFLEKRLCSFELQTSTKHQLQITHLNRLRHLEQHPVLAIDFDALYDEAIGSLITLGILDSANNISSVHISRLTTSLDEVARQALSKKLKDDFSHAFIHTRNSLESAAARTLEGLRTSLTKSGWTDRRIPDPNALSYFPDTSDLREIHSAEYAWRIHQAAWKGELREITKQFMRAMRQIRVGSAAIHPSVEAALLHLKLYGVEVVIDSDAKHGVDQVDKIETGKSEYDYDFMILADANMFQRGSRFAYDYVYVMPVFGQPHHVIRKKMPKRGPTQLFIARDSSAEHQHKLSIGTDKFTEIKYTDIHSLPGIIQNLLPGQVVLGWEPLRSALAVGPSYATNQVREYELTTSLYCNRRLWLEDRNQPSPMVGAFVEGFIAAWNKTKKDLTATAIMLASDPRFLRRFYKSW